MILHSAHTETGREYDLEKARESERKVDPVLRQLAKEREKRRYQDCTDPTLRQRASMTRTAGMMARLTRRVRSIPRPPSIIPTHMTGRSTALLLAKDWITYKFILMPR